MQSCEQVDTGDFRIYAGAVERPEACGFVASVVVVRKSGLESYRDENLAGGFTWATRDDALRFAINAGRDAVMCCRAGSLT